MSKWISKFGPALRLLTVFGIGAAGVTAALPRGQAPAPAAKPEPEIQFARPPAVVIEPAATVGRTVLVAADVIPWPWLDDLSQVELSEALLADLSRSRTTLPPADDAQFVAPVAPPPDIPADTLFYDEPILPVAATARLASVLAPNDRISADAALAATTPAASGY